MYKLLEIDKIREQRWDIVRLIIAEREQLALGAMFKQIVDYSHDFDVQPDHVVNQNKSRI